MIAAVFPGQGSQKPGMGKELAETFSAAKTTYARVFDATGVDVAQLSWFEDEEVLRQTQNAQLALFTASLAAHAVLISESDLKIEAVAGHSVGEFSALVVAGVYGLEEAAKLVQVRGRTMAKAGISNPGAMSAVLGLDSDQLKQICEETQGLVSVANDNSPGQVVISGEQSAVSAAGASALTAGAKRVIPLNVSGAFHSPLMRGPAQELKAELLRYQPANPTLRIYSNVTSEPAMEGESWPELLERQLVSPVRWTESIQNMVRDGVDTTAECGVGEILSGLIRRIDKSIRCLKVFDVASLKDCEAQGEAGL